MGATNWAPPPAASWWTGSDDIGRTAFTVSSERSGVESLDSDEVADDDDDSGVDVAVACCCWAADDTDTAAAVALIWKPACGLTRPNGLWATGRGAIGSRCCCCAVGCSGVGEVAEDSDDAVDASDDDPGPVAEKSHSSDDDGSGELAGAVLTVDVDVS